MLCTRPDVTSEIKKGGGVCRWHAGRWTNWTKWQPMLGTGRPGDEKRRRFCVDYHRLNIATYRLPRIDDILDMLAGKQWFSTLDLASGYWQVSLSQEAQIKTAFATHAGLFQFKVMPFGLCNTPAIFERLMDRVLQGLWWSRCLVYLDDIISFGTTFDDALDNLTLIFVRPIESTKCNLFQTSVPFLGHSVGRRGLECDPKKIGDVKSWPDCLKSVHQFLGFVGYNRRFIPNFADLAIPLVALTGKDVPFVWRPVCSTSFYVFDLIQSAWFSHSRYWPFLRRPDSTYWTQTPVILVWVESWARFRMMWNVLSLIAVVLLGFHRDVIAQQNMRCWPLYLFAYSSVPTYVAPNSPFELTTNHWCGCTDSRIPRVWWPYDYMLYSSYSVRLFTGPVEIMVMWAASLEYPHHRADSVLVRNAHRLI